MYFYKQNKISTAEVLLEEITQNSNDVRFFELLCYCQLNQDHISDAQATLSPKKIEVSNFDGKLGKSDLQISGQLDNILAYFSPNKTLTGDIKLRSNYFNADEWLTESESATPSTSSTPKVDQPVADQYNFDIDAEMRKIDYDVYQLTDLSVLLSLYNVPTLHY